MKKTLVSLLVVTASAWLLCPLENGARAQTPEATDPAAVECSQEELTAKVPELENLHEVIYQLWHEAYPEKNCKLIKELLPQADELTAKLDAAELPGILRDKQAKWDEGKVTLKNSLAALHKAADANDEAAMLTETEAYHAAYEGLVRTIRPVVPALDAFHQELYKLYHYHAPAYDLEAIRADAAAMQKGIPALKESTLPKRVADQQEKYNAAVVSLATAVDDLVKTCAKDDKATVLASVEKVHMAYVQTNAIFD